MRILLTSIICRSGLFTHVVDLANTLVDMGIEVTIAFYFRGRRLRSLHKSLLSRLREVPYRLYSRTDELLAIALEFGPTVLHAHSSKAFMASLKVAKTIKRPLVLTIHGVAQWEKRYRPALAGATHIIAVGPAQADSVSTFKKKLSIIPNGVDIDTFSPSSIQKVDGPLQVIWFGRTHGVYSQGAKALDTALMLARSKGIEVDGTMLGIASGVEIKHMRKTGWLEDPIPLLREGHIAFGHGRALREAMACGNVGFLLGDGYGGLVQVDWFGAGMVPLDAFPEYQLSPLDASRIAADITRLYMNRLLLKELQTMSRRIAERFFDVREMAKKVAKVYKKWQKPTNSSTPVCATNGIIL